jgi:hypothetical protein
MIVVECVAPGAMPLEEGLRVLPILRFGFGSQDSTSAKTAGAILAPGCETPNVLTTHSLLLIIVLSLYVDLQFLVACVSTLAQLYRASCSFDGSLELPWTAVYRAGGISHAANLEIRSDLSWLLVPD